MNNEQDMLGYDFQGWPIYKKNLREIISAIGFKIEDGKWTMDNSNPLLDCYPVTLEDDGMGYGINEKFIEEVGVVEGSRINIFIDKKHEKEEE